MKPAIRVLHVDDDAAFLKTAKQCLELQGHFQVDTVMSVEEALEKLRKEEYDAVVSDYQMPGKDGLELLMELRDEENSIPFVMFTGKGREEVAVKALNLGADNYVNKYGDPKTVYAELAHDIHTTVKRTRAENASLKSDEKYRSLVENIDDAIFTIDANGRLTYVSPYAERVTGFTLDDVLGKPFLDFFEPAIAERAALTFAKILKGETVRGLEIEIPRKDGKRAYYEMNIYPVFSSGKILGVQGIARDVTERKRTQEALKKNEELLKLALTSAKAGTWDWDIRTNKVGWSDEYYRVFGLEPDSMQSSYENWLKCVHPQDRDRANKEVVDAVKDKHDFNVEYRTVWPDGTTHWINGKGEVFHDGNEPSRMIGICTDVTENKEREAMLKSLGLIVESSINRSVESEDRHRELANSLPEIVFETDVKRKLTFVNQKAFDITGCTQEDFASDLKILRFIVPEDRDRARETLKKLLDGKNIGANEYTFVRKDGSTFPVLIRSIPIFREDKVAGTIDIVMDITERKKAEESAEKSEKKLGAMNEKLRVVGELTRHDIRNKLSTIVGNLYLSKKKLANHPETLENFKNLESACNQIVRILDFAKAYEMLGVEELTYVNVEQAFQQAVSLFSDLKGMTVKNECRGLTVLADSLLRQLFYNLVDNSLKYGEKANQIRIFYKRFADGKLKIVYEDNGVGIPSAVKLNLFKEGFTTGNGSGYGLHLIRKMTEIYGWTIEETGKPRKGARFTITIPKTNQSRKENYQLR
jgi:PAS domain S-box-containing protein